jgi:hypothetical protein
MEQEIEQERECLLRIIEEQIDPDLLKNLSAALSLLQPRDAAEVIVSMEGTSSALA